MTDHKIGTREEWLAAELELLVRRVSSFSATQDAPLTWFRRHDEYDSE